MKVSLAFLFSLLLFFVVFPRQVVHAEDAGTQSAAVSPTPVSDYTLPYPGILPDNPLYSLKVLRDRLISFFISSPSKKSSFYLLQSDKRLEASLYLLKKDGKNGSLVESTLSKSTNYLQQSLEEARKADSNGEDIGDLRAKLKAAVAKHIGVVGAMLHLPGGSRINDLTNEEKRLQDLQKSVNEFSNKQ